MDISKHFNINLDQDSMCFFIDESGEVISEL